VKNIRKVCVKRARAFVQLINSVKKGEIQYVPVAIRVRHSVGINVFEKLSERVKARCPVTGKCITERYLKSKQISIMGICCTFTRGVDVVTRKCRNIVREKKNTNVLFHFSLGDIQIIVTNVYFILLNSNR